MGKVRVRDLSTELGVSNKELIQTLRELDIHAKSHMSGLTEEEADAARAKIKDVSKSIEIVRKEVRPGLVVRRRRKVTKPAESVEPVASEAVVEPEVIEPEVAAPEVVEPEVVEPEVVEPEVAEPDAVESAEPPEAAEVVEEKAKKKKKARKKKSLPSPKVKVISMPEPVPEKPAEPEPVLEEIEPAPKPKSPLVEPAPTDKGKRKKDKRVVDFSPYLVDEEEKKVAGLQARKKKRAESGLPGRVRRGRRKKGQELKEAAEAAATTQPIKAAKRKVKVDEAIRVADMAKQMGVKARAVIKALFGLGVMATINQSLDLDTATLVASEFGYSVEKVGFSEEEFLLPDEVDASEDLKPRAPVVTIMGHVDHGKTSLLDAFRKSDVISGEAGSITQHIGAYDVTTSRGKVVFLDTPGHEAFTAMRARGAKVTDLVVLVVAADDGVMDQTREAVSHSKAADVPIVVAVNKIDKDDADPDRVRREMADLGLVPEEWGGDTIFVNISAKKRIGLDELLELLLLQAEVLELRANPDKRAVGRIIEARLDKGRGPVATALVQGGTLRKGDAFVCGVHYGRVRGMLNDEGKKVKQVGPAVPVEIQGFDGVPEAGDEFICTEDDKVARRIATSRRIKERERLLAKATKVTLESFLAAKADEEAKSLNLIIKADVQGSLEAISEALNKLSTDEVKINLLHGGAGAITESDILLASASAAIIIGFNVRPAARIKNAAELENVEIRSYDIIYKLVSDIKDAMAGMLAPVYTETYLGQAEVRETFNVPKVGTIAGCGVVDGKLVRNAGVRLLREGVVLYTGKLSSLKRFKDDVKEVTKGYECGAGLENFNDVKIGDVLEAFEEVREKPSLE
ncbi:MAG: translation initiation factor IF-2 [Thermodesulfobacteriota bacterium]|nr:translation initiation factor IF-2 [Thermodesulfobacteriota bacterium]